MNTPLIEFIEFPKIPRLCREVIVTEKIDGTNATIYIAPINEVCIQGAVCTTDSLAMFAASRSRWITPQDDNYGFARWAAENKDKLLKLGMGWHRGEWWGSGIQRGYGLPKGEKRWSLFNTVRWAKPGCEPQRIPSQDPRNVKYQDVLPACCNLVPELYRGPFDSARIEAALTYLGATGSVASPEYASPEGIIIFHTAANMAFKRTLCKDDAPKSKV